MIEQPGLNTEDIERIRRRDHRLGIWLKVGFIATLLGMAASPLARNLRAFSQLPWNEVTRIQMQFFLRPYILLPWIVFIAYGFREVWRGRADWKYDRNVRLISIVLALSVCTLLVNVIRFHLY
jgi:hypothetical protein